MPSTPPGVIQLLDDATAVNGAPSAASDGVALPQRWGEAVALARSTAGSGTMSVTLKLWVYWEGSADGSGDAVGWYPLGTDATAADKGKLNEGNAIDETGTDLIAHVERVVGLNAFTRAYMEVVAISGTATAISAWMAKTSGAHYTAI